MRKLFAEAEGVQRFVMLSVSGLTAVALAATSGALATAGTTKASGTAASVVVSTKTLPKLGAVLVNAKGLTLYMFLPDKDKKVTCVGPCAIAWPPLKIAAGAKATASGGAKAALLGSDADPSGGRVVTYKGWPLYTWLGDKKPGQATGQALNVNGGLWYVLSPSGVPIRTAASSGGSKPKGGGGGSADGCPAGTTVAQSPQNDQDADNFAGGADDFDGCL